jgi:hypothetical protein
MPGSEVIETHGPMGEDRANLGWKAVIEWFGCMPNFHDAEVLSLELRRAPELSVVRVHVWRTLDEVDEGGYFRRDRHAVVSFVLKDIIRQELRWWNHQNVLSGLHIAESPDGATLVLEAIYGIEGEIVAKEISLAIEPLSPHASV